MEADDILDSANKICVYQKWRSRQHRGKTSFNGKIVQRYEDCIPSPLAYVTKG